MFSPSTHTFSEIFLHFNWHCHGDQGLILPELEPHLYKIIEERCRNTKGVWFQGIGGTETHLHLVLQVEPIVTPADLVGQLKGGSSHDLNERWGRGSLKWQRGYGVVSFATRDLKAVLRYVAGQKEHHRRGTVREKLENGGYMETEYPELEWRKPR